MEKLGMESEEFKQYLIQLQTGKIIPSMFKKKKDSKDKTKQILTNPIRCFKCEYMTFEKKLYDKHVRQHLVNKPVACDQCKFRTTTRYLLGKHLIQHLPKDQRPAPKPYVKKHKCGYCHYAARDKYTITRHEKRHKGEMDYVCPRCDFKTSQPTNLTYHLRTRHWEERPFACTECKFTCADKTAMLQHRSWHKGSGVFECTECQFAFLSRKVYDEHMENIHGDPPVTRNHNRLPPSKFMHLQCKALNQQIENIIGRPEKRFRITVDDLDLKLTTVSKVLKAASFLACKPKESTAPQKYSTEIEGGKTLETIANRACISEGGTAIANNTTSRIDFNMLTPAHLHTCFSKTTLVESTAEPIAKQSRDHLQLPPQNKDKLLISDPLNIGPLISEEQQQITSCSPLVLFATCSAVDANGNASKRKKAMEMELCQPGATADCAPDDLPLPLLNTEDFFQLQDKHKNDWLLSNPIEEDPILKETQEKEQSSSVDSSTITFSFDGQSLLDSENDLVDASASATVPVLAATSAYQGPCLTAETTPLNYIKSYSRKNVKTSPEAVRKVENNTWKSEEKLELFCAVDSPVQVKTEPMDQQEIVSLASQTNVFSPAMKEETVTLGLKGTVHKDLTHTQTRINNIYSAVYPVLPKCDVKIDSSDVDNFKPSPEEKSSYLFIESEPLANNTEKDVKTNGENMVSLEKNAQLFSNLGDLEKKSVDLTPSWHKACSKIKPSVKLKQLEKLNIIPPLASGFEPKTERELKFILTRHLKALKSGAIPPPSAVGTYFGSAVSNRLQAKIITNRLLAETEEQKLESILDKHLKVIKGAALPRITMMRPLPDPPGISEAQRSQSQRSYEKNSLLRMNPPLPHEDHTMQKQMPWMPTRGRPPKKPLHATLSPESFLRLKNLLQARGTSDQHELVDSKKLDYENYEKEKQEYGIKECVVRLQDIAKTSKNCENNEIQSALEAIVMNKRSAPLNFSHLSDHPRMRKVPKPLQRRGRPKISLWERRKQEKN